MNLLRDLWDEARQELPLFERQRPILTSLVWIGVITFVWLALQKWHPTPPGAFASGGCLALAVLLVLLLAVRSQRAARWEARAGVVVLGALGLVSIALPPALGRAALGIGLCCLGLAGVLGSRLGKFGLGLTALLGAGLVLITWARSGLSQTLLLTAGLAVLWFAGPLLARHNRRMMRQQAASEERERLAREIHDVLAHTLSALSVQIEGARMLMEQRPGDPRALAVMERAQRLVAAGLEEAGQAVAALRGDVLPAPDALRRLAQDFERDSGVPCRFQVEGTPLRLSPDSSLAIYRAAQEALTNVRKHAEAAAVSIDLRYLDRRAELIVCDRGTTRPSLASSGFGLVGIKERTELLGGELEAGPTADGFQVRVSVPA